QGEKEVWQCRVYRDRGRAACAAPQLRSTELDAIMAQIFDSPALNKQVIVDTVVRLILSVPDEHDYGRDARRIESDLSEFAAKKDRLLEMSVAEAIGISEFKKRNDGFNEQMELLEQKLKALRGEEQKSKVSLGQTDKIRAALEEELSSEGGIDSELTSTILDHIVVKIGSTKEQVLLELHLKFGDPCGVVFDRPKCSFRFLPS
ncbi:MAG: recombinase family protein, partial [Oscillospiraceae bacterium]